MKIAIVGQGYVGLPLAIKAGNAGHEVIGFDVSDELVERLNSGISHVEDVDSSELQNLINSGFYRATANPKDFAQVEIVIIAVPTPLTADRLPDLSFVESAASIIGRNLETSALVINESTSYPGTLRDVIAPIVAKSSSKGIAHEFAVSPERVDPGSSDWSISNTPRIYSGLSELAMNKTEEFYSSFCTNLIRVDTPEIAESAKLFENTFRQVNIALVNEFALIMRALNIPVHQVLEAAATKPYGFMKFSPGIGVGGHCIPVDPSYLSFVANQAKISPRFIDLANSVNLDMPKAIVSRIIKENGGSINGKSVLVCGVSYKANVSDVRESPSDLLISELNATGAIVDWHDPLVEKFQDSTSASLENRKYDIVIVAILHTVMDRQAITRAGNYIFDCTGTLTGANTL